MKSMNELMRLVSAGQETVQDVMDTSAQRDDELIDELMQERVAINMKTTAQRLPPRFTDANLESVESDLREKMLAAVDAGRGLYLYGDTGLGKTYASAAMALELARREKSVYWFNTAELLYRMRESFNGGERSLALDKMRSAGVVVLDDIGVENPSQWAVETLSVVVNKVYENMSLLIVTSNLSPRHLGERLGTRLAGRVVENCDVIKMSGKNRRTQR